MYIWCLTVHLSPIIWKCSNSLIFSTSDSSSDVLMLSKVRLSGERMWERMRESSHWFRHITWVSGVDAGADAGGDAGSGCGSGYYFSKSHWLRQITWLRIRSRESAPASAPKNPLPYPLPRPLPFVMWSVLADQRLRNALSYPLPHPLPESLHSREHLLPRASAPESIRSR